MNYNDENHIYLIFCSLFCSRDPVKVKYIQLVLLSTINYIQTTKACNLCKSLIYSITLLTNVVIVFVVILHISHETQI